jgi:hypothetical protein
MSNQPENEIQQSMTPEEARQSLLAELEASQQAIAELSNEQLEEIVGGAGFRDVIHNFILKCITCGGQQSSPHTSPNESPRSSFSDATASEGSESPRSSASYASGSEGSVGNGRTIYRIPSPTSTLTRFVH